MDWIHCNNCFTLRSESPENLAFFVTNCGHIFCSRCTDGSDTKCLVQNNDCSYSSLTAVQREHEELFMSPVHSLNKCTRSLAFQLEQWSSWINYLQKNMQKYISLKQELLILKSESKRHRDEKNKYKKELIDLHEEVRQLKKQLHKHQLDRSSNSNNYFGDKNSDPQSSSERGRHLFGAVSSNAQLSFSPLAQNTTQVFTPPQPVTCFRAYRDNNVYNLATPQRNSIYPSPPSSECTPRPAVRKIMLPGDRMASPVNRIGLQSLSLKCTPSAERNSQSNRTVGRQVVRQGKCSNPRSKYNKYF